MLPFSDPHFLKIKKILSCYTKRAYFVGGCVRDIYFNKSSDDYDIEIYDVSEAQMQKIANKLNAAGVGKSFFVYKYFNYDLALARTETKIGVSHTDFRVKIENDEYKASLRRDFCMNAIMINIFTKKVLDLHSGIDDCYNHRIRILNYSSFLEDSLRVLRFVQFIARFKLKTNKNDLTYLKKIDISNLSVERISAELIKLFNSPYPELGLYYLYKLDLFNKCFGFSPEKSRFYKVLSDIKNNKNLICKQKRFALMFYYFKNDFKNDLLSFKKRLNLLKNEPFLSEINDFNLCKVAVKMPLKDWMGLNKNIIKRAKELGIFDKKITVNYAGVSSKDEANKREEQAIKEFLCLI